MKKYFFILLVFLLTIFTVSAKTVDNRVFKVDNLNSNELFEFLRDLKFKSNTIKICNQDYCDYLKYQNLEKSVDKYIEDYINFIKEKTDEDTSVRVYLKGFKITDIYFY